jgi:hypothetical protein
VHSLLVSFLEPSRDASSASSSLDGFTRARKTGDTGPSQATASPSLRVAIQLAQEENDAQSNGVDKEDDNATRGDYGQGKSPLVHFLLGRVVDLH